MTVTSEGVLLLANEEERTVVKGLRLSSSTTLIQMSLLGSSTIIGVSSSTSNSAPSTYATFVSATSPVGLSSTRDGHSKEIIEPPMVIVNAGNVILLIEVAIVYLRAVTVMVGREIGEFVTAVVKVEAGRETGDTKPEQVKLAAPKLTVDAGNVNVTVCSAKFDAVTVTVDADRVTVDMSREVTIIGVG